MKRMVNRVLARLAMFLIAIILGAIAVAQAQKGFEESRVARNAETGPVAAVQSNAFTPIPVAELADASPPEYARQAPQEMPADRANEFAPPPPMANNFTAHAQVEDAGAESQFAPASDFAGPGQYAAIPVATTQVRPTAGEFEDGELASPDNFASAASADHAEIELPPISSVPAEFQPPAQMPAGNFQPAARMTAPPMQFSDDPVEPDGGVADEAQQQDDVYGNPYNNVYMPPANQAPPANIERDSHERDSGRMSMPAPASRQATAPRQTFAPAADQDLRPRAENVNAGSLAAAVSTGKPGPPELEGPQTPSLSVTKKSPREVQVGKPAKFHIVVRNNGQVPAQDVVIRDQVPHGTQLVDTNPPARSDAEGAILWEMGTLRPGTEITVMMELLPMEEGDIGSVATVTFEAAASARTLVTKPQLTLEHTTARQVLVGEEVVFNIKMSNPGTGVATNVAIEENVPEGLQHYNGQELEYQVGTLRPGETRILELTLKADKPGMVHNTLFARADGEIEVQDVCELEVVAPELRVEITGPKRRYLERRASFEIHVANPGTAAAHNVELVAHLPRALRFIKTNNSGNYDPQRHVVIWNLAELPPQEMGTVQIETKPVQMGDHAIQVDARASMGLADSVEHHVSVDGLAALLYTVTDVSDPIEVGGETTYEIQIVNQGSKEATNLQLGALIPAGMEAINGEGPTRANVNGSQLVFEPLPRLGPQADAAYKIHVKGITPGDKRIQVQLISDDISEPVTKEESTHVYADE